MYVFRFYQLSGQEIASATIWDKLLNRATSSTSNYRITSDRCLAALCVCRGLEKSNTPDIGRVSSKLKVMIFHYVSSFIDHDWMHLIVFVCYADFVTFCGMESFSC